MTTSSEDMGLHENAGSLPARRGRSTKGPGAESETRRERNRRAQHVFRLRKQAAQLAQDTHVKKLEQITEQMCLDFVTLAGEVLQSEAARTDPQLMQRLKESIERTVHLARSASEYEPDHLQEEPSQPSTADRASPSTLANADHPEDNAMGFEDFAGGLSSLKGGLASRSDGTKPAITRLPPPDQLPSSSNGDTQTIFQNITNSDTVGLSPNVFGNGLTLAFDSGGTAAASSQWSNLNPFMFDWATRLVQFCLHNAFHIILTAVDLSKGEAYRTFEFRLQKQSRNELLQSFRWFLGPGYSDSRLQKMINANFDNPLDIAAGQTQVLGLDAGSKTHNPLRSVSSFRSGSHSKPWLNAKDVEDYLRARKVRFIDDSTLELAVNDSLGYEDVGHDHHEIASGQSGNPALVQTFINTNAFFPTETHSGSETTPQSRVNSHVGGRYIRLSASLLYRNIFNIGVCLATGPGFRADSLENAIAASVISY